MLSRKTLIVLVSCLLVLSLSAVSVGAQDAPSVKIYTSWPLTGGTQAIGVSMLNAVKLAVTHYMADHDGKGPGGASIEVVSLDDASSTTGAWDGTIEAENAQRCVNDEACLVYMGTYNSGAAKVSMPITNQAGIAQVSPANSYAGLTRACGPDCAEGEPGIYRPSGQVNYFRVTATDDVQGPADAAWAQCLGFSKVYIIDDTQAYGAGIAKTFETQAKALGIDVVGHQSMETPDSDPRTLLTEAVSKGAQAIFGGFVLDSGGPKVIQSMSDEGLFDQGIKFMGPDGLLSPALIDQVGGADILNGNTYFSFPGLLPNLLTNDQGTRFYNDYKSTYNNEEPDPYAVYAYAAAQVVLNGMEQAAATSDGITRATVLDAIRSTKDFDGIIGKFGFDENGDNTKAAFYGYTFTDGSFANPESITADMAPACGAGGEATPEATAAS